MATPSVLHLNTERGWRGGERQALLLAANLQQRGHRTWLGARPRDYLAGYAAARGVSVIGCRPAWEFDPLCALSLRRFIRRHGIEIVHAHCAHAHALAALAVAGTSARLVVSRRVDFPPRANRPTAWKYARADAVIAISNAVPPPLRNAGVPHERVHIVPSGIELPSEPRSRSRAAAAALGIPADAPLAVMAAALVPHKDHLRARHRRRARALPTSTRCSSATAISARTSSARLTDSRCARRFT